MLFVFFNQLTSKDREAVLIVDDSPYDRSRSKMVELLVRIWDHSTKRYLKGFRMLTVCWSDGTSCLPLDFSLPNITICTPHDTLRIPQYALENFIMNRY